MKKIVCFLLIIVVVFYFFLTLGIELDLKYVIEFYGVIKEERLIYASFEIRRFITIQLGLFMLMFIACLFFLFRKNH